MKLPNFPKLSFVRSAILIAAFGPFSIIDSCRADAFGIRHRIDMTVSAEPDSPLIKRGHQVRGWLSIIVRLSANSRESRFFGVLDREFSDVLITEKAEPLVSQTKIWEEDICHQRRGIPKVTVVGVKGRFEQENEKIEIGSANRRIGIRVPADELTPGIKLLSDADDLGSFYAFRAQTRLSRLNVDLKIYAFGCPL